MAPQQRTTPEILRYVADKIIDDKTTHIELLAYGLMLQHIAKELEPASEEGP